MVSASPERRAPVPEMGSTRASAPVSARATVPPPSACPRSAPLPRWPRFRYRHRKPPLQRWRSSPRATPGSRTQWARRRRIWAARCGPRCVPRARSRRPRVVARRAPAPRAFAAPRARPVSSIATLALVVVRIGKANNPRAVCSEAPPHRAAHPGGHQRRLGKSKAAGGDRRVLSASRLFIALARCLAASPPCSAVVERKIFQRARTRYGQGRCSTKRTERSTPS